MAPKTLKIRSWNVNGIRACERKGFSGWLKESKAWFVGVQEFRALKSDLPESLDPIKGWHFDVHAAERKGYSGVAYYSKDKPDKVDITLGVDDFDKEGRLQICHFGKLTIANVYFPNGSGKNRDKSRVPFKLEFYQTLFALLEHHRQKGQRVVCLGDFNTAPYEIDLARPKQNRKTSGFLLEECEEVERWLEHGWVDSFREFEKGEGFYSWWSQRKGVREKNVGWRIDLMLLCPEARKFLKKAFIFSDTMGSDHCPIGIDLDSKILD